MTNPEIPAVTDALKTSKLVEQLGKEVKGVIVTRKSNSKTEMPISNIKDMLELPIIGVVPEDQKIKSALVMKDAVIHTHPYSKSAIAYKKIAAKIAGVQYREPSLWNRMFG